MAVVSIIMNSRVAEKKGDIRSVGRRRTGTYHKMHLDCGFLEILSQKLELSFSFPQDWKNA